LFKFGKSFLIFVFISLLAALGLMFFFLLTGFARYFVLLVGAYLVLSFGLLFYFQNGRSFLTRLNLKKEEVLEAFNITEQEIIRLQGLRVSLGKKIKSYERLEKFTQGLNNEVSLDRICDLIAGELFELFDARGNVLLYLVNPASHKLELRAIKKEDAAIRIREKAGDIFDMWVLRHNQPLLIESAASDFRFDPERIKDEIRRPVESLMAIPLETTESRTLGILRIDAAAPHEYSSDDLRLLSVIGDIARLAIENAVYFAQMQNLSITDGLTGIYLRRYAIDRLKEEFLRARHGSSCVSFVMVDIDHFKTINDTYGHMAGDAVLKKIAQWLHSSFNFPGQLVFRYGGEEFGVILPGVLKKEAARLADGFRRSLSEKDVSLRREKIAVRISAGVATFPDDVDDERGLIQAADEALLKAKRAGRDKVCPS